MKLMRSWVESANNPDGEFPLNNLPYGVFSVAGDAPRCGVAIGDMILDVAGMEAAGLLRIADDFVLDVPFWNEVMELGPDAWQRLRIILFGFLTEASETKDALTRYLVPREKARMHMPLLVAEYTDFYAGMHHAKNMGAIMRGSPDLPANWLHIPIGYNGRASSVVVSGTDIRRPLGQTKTADAKVPEFGPSKRLDIELEIGAIVGTGSSLGQPITTAQAQEMIFGYVLLNDWSARDIQGWEYQPLGPFQGKAFGTTISPWIVSPAALEPFRCAAPAREVPLLPYLEETRPGFYNIELEVLMQSEGAASASTIARTNYNRVYFSAAQQLAHHAVCGCEMNPGDLLGSGTISGPEAGEFGSLMELAWGGKKPIKLDSGETRSFIEDGDRLTLRGHAQGDGFRIGFGDCTGRILPAVSMPGW
ncbi:fumarylacetoacetase [Pseudorhodobacter sp.]|uniref:fumarylacetoacetase n=1 Tax=Pseudorhodobacter sp. TaxID=1934400 RepID=UPI00264776F3|nr:fumarylacetoacetase [Pseudorhodobacter sp.]MDN5785922.1 fumarylacetoacetase [Pseudorhodobacter sp.]